MKIKFLGTAAAEGLPAPFCGCETCQKARRLGGRNLRSRSQALIDDRLLIDFPVDTFMHCWLHSMDLTKVNHCLITHEHEDHWSPEDLVYMQKPFAHPPADWEGLTIYGSCDVEDRLQAMVARGAKKLSGVTVPPFVPFTAGGYTVTALKARHGTKNPYVYTVSDGSKTILYAHDTDIFKEETWEYLKNSDLHFDLVSLDCTEGAMEELNYHGHGCLGWDIRFRDLLKEAGVADESTVFVLNHFSHNGLHSCYDDFAPIAAKEGFITSYDGLELEV